MAEAVLLGISAMAGVVAGVLGTLALLRVAEIKRADEALLRQRSSAWFSV